MDPQTMQSDRQTLAFEYQADSGRWSWSQGLRDLHGLLDGEHPTTQVLLNKMVAEDRPLMLARFQHHLENEGPYSCVYRMTDPTGETRRLVFVGQSEAVAGIVKRLTGFVVDITEPVREGARQAVEASSKHRAAIEQAKGALMITFGVDDEIAFELLKAYSSLNNIKLASVAEQIVVGLADPSFSRDEPVRCLLDIVTAVSGVTGRRDDGALLNSQ